jgi:hypothetical protein
MDPEREREKETVGLALPPREFIVLQLNNHGGSTQSWCIIFFRPFYHSLFWLFFFFYGKIYLGFAIFVALLSLSLSLSSPYRKRITRAACMRRFCTFRIITLMNKQSDDERFF